MRPIVPVATALTLLMACAPQPGVPPLPASLAPADLQSNLAEMIPPLLEQYNVPGASVAVLVDGDIVLARGYGLSRAGDTAAPVDEHTVFQAASLSKPLVAFGVHRLLAARPQDLNLDQPLMEHRPPDTPYRDGDPRFGQITPRIVMSHSTGFPNWRPGYHSNNPKPLEIQFEPGTRFQYSGEGYVYLQRVVEHITREPLDAYLHRAVLEPLGMTDSSFVWQQRFENRHATPHDARGRPQAKYRPRQASAAGTLQTTATDYARFLRTVLGDGPDGTGSWLARESTIDDSLGWSLGWGFEANERGDVFWQWGDDGDSKAQAAGARERGVAVVVFTNGHNGLNIARPVVESVLGGDLKFLDFRMLNY